MQRKPMIFTFIHKGILRIHSYKGVLKMLRYPNTLCINVNGGRLTLFNWVFFIQKLKILFLTYSIDTQSIKNYSGIQSNKKTGVNVKIRT
jgi:hypothetical protein